MRSLIELLERIADVIEKVQTMAGGRKRGQLVFWITFALIVALLLYPAYNSVESVFSRLSEMSPLLTVISALALIFAAVALFVGLTYAIAVIIGWSMRTAFATPFSNRIDVILLYLIHILKNASDNEVDKQSTKELLELLDDTEKMCRHWNALRITRFIHWITKHEKPSKVRS